MIKKKEMKICMDRNFYRDEKKVNYTHFDKLAFDVVKGITEQREEILKAFIAKYNLQPDECEQVVIPTASGCVNNAYTWYIRRRVKQ